MRRDRKHLRSGFTLMEVVLVLLVIAVSAAITAPRLSNFVRGRLLPNAALELATTLRWCRVMALSEGVAYRLNLDPDERKYWITKDDGSGYNFTTITGEYALEVVLPDGVSMSCPDIPVEEEGIYITFRPGGQKDVAVITLSSDTQTLDITCETPNAPYRVYDPISQRLVR